MSTVIGREPRYRTRRRRRLDRPSRPPVLRRRCARQRTLAPRSGALRCGLRVEKAPQNASLPACLIEAEVDVSTQNDGI